MDLVFIVVGAVLVIVGVGAAVLLGRRNAARSTQEEPVSRISVSPVAEAEAEPRADIQAQAGAQRTAEAGRAAQAQAAAAARAAEQAERAEHERRLAERAAAQRAALEERRRAAEQTPAATPGPSPLPARRPGAGAVVGGRPAVDPAKARALPKRGENRLAQAEKVAPVRPVPQGTARGRIGDFRPRR